MLAQMPEREFQEWMAFSQLEPFGAAYENLLAGLVTAAVYNVNRDPKKSSRLFQPGDFLLDFEPQEKATVSTPEELYQGFRRWAVAMGATTTTTTKGAKETEGAKKGKDEHTGEPDRQAGPGSV